MLLIHALLALTPQASAHAGAEITAIDSDRSDVVETSFGVLVERDDAWRWVCHEAVTTPTALLTPKYSFGPDGTWMATVPAPDQARDSAHTVYRSEDGCDWEPVEGLSGEVISALGFVHAERLVAVTADLEPGGTAGIFSSDDGGETWSQVATAEPGSLFLRIEIIEDAVWTVSFDPSRADSAVAWRSADGGASFTSQPLDVSAWATDAPLPVSAMAAASDERAWLAVSVATGHVLLETTDGGRSFEAALEVQGAISDAALDAEGGLWVVEGNSRLWHRPADGAFTEVDAPAGIGIAVEGTTGRLSSSAVRVGALIYTIELGQPAEPTLIAEDLAGPLACPAGSDQEAICVELWDQVQINRPDDTDEPGPDPTDDTDDGSADPPCGCRTSPISGALLVLLAPLLWRRRQ